LALVKIVSVDKAGRMVLPKKAREQLGIEGDGVLLMEVKDSEVVLRRSTVEKSPSKAISKMRLPTGSWNKIEREIEEGVTLSSNER
jgi:AbrB family looped-hinge helix DNA binding protein